ncbi:MAG TPA: helix-turn-helix domain-containing protein [Candidatus Saccharimonadales bacterium]|nr:helix-turn-helix domain-containing protein [Candidatus Saccharimonadales bacterium]
MSTDIDSVRLYFGKLGLEPEIADIYLALHAYGPQSITALSRNSHIERTRIYRLAESLRTSGLVEIEKHYKREIYKAAPITNLQILLSKKEEELRELHTELANIHSALDSDSLTSPLTHVQFYRGVEGTKQMFWNQTRAKTENLCILYENMQNRVGATFFDRWVRKCNDQNIHFRGIISEAFMPGQESWYKKRRNERLEHWEQRSVSSAVFPVTHSCVTYDDVVAYYNWKDGEVFGIEIYNQEIADAQRHFFEMLWNLGESVKDVNLPKGKAALDVPLQFKDKE